MRRLRTDHLHGQTACVPPQQLGKMRRILEVQEEGIIECKQKLALLLSAVNITE